MSAPSLTAEELLAWNDTTAERWRVLTSGNPELLQVPCDIHRCATVGQLLQHIVAAELRYAERLADSEVTDYPSIPFTTSAEIFTAHTQAFAILKSLLATPSFDWDQEIELMTLTAGRRRALRRAVFQHALLHSIRHYAQLATIARQHGFAPGPMDYLFTNSTPVT
ncbi:MAG: DinB family protein [Acidobacteriaceae bacterium]|nr:DinB family protein [Acidobacteriaceae bacterium]